MVLRYTRTRSVDTRPLVSGSRRGARTERVSSGEDWSSVTVGLRPCLRVGCICRRVLGGSASASCGTHVWKSWQVHQDRPVVGSGVCDVITSCTTVRTGLCVPRRRDSQVALRKGGSKVARG